MNADKLFDVLGKENIHSDQSYKLNGLGMIKESSNVVTNGAGSKGLFFSKSSKQNDAKRKISKSLWDVDNGAGSKGLFLVSIIHKQGNN